MSEGRMSTTVDNERSRPLDPQGLAARVAPFAAVLLIAFAFVNLKHDGGSPNLIIIAAAVSAVIVLAVGALPWRILPSWTQTFPPLAFFVLVAVLIDVDGGSSSSFAPLALVPVMWLALYGTRGQMLVGILGAIAVFLVPIVWLGEPHYPPSQWQTPTMWMITVALVGTVVHELVVEMRARAVGGAVAASSDELTSLPSRAAWEERLPRELKRGEREGWQVSVALFVLDGDVDDATIRETAFSWASQLRGTDLMARYDSDAFAVAFPGCSLGSAMQLADRMRDVAAGVTVFTGIACWDGEEDKAALMGRVSAAVAEARQLGGGMVVPAAMA
jgi:diguanylate cyclase (GGDEF)-like protein